MLPTDWQIRLVDMNAYQLKEEDIQWADCVFVSAMIAQNDSARDIVALCSAHGKKVVLGGPVLETEEFCQKFPGASHYFLGEAEDTLPESLADLEKGSTKRVYPAKGYPNLAKSPIPRYDLVNPEDYGSGAIQDSRGCPFRCTFCNVSVLNGRKWRTKEPSQILAELDALYKAGFRGSVQVFSDNFVGNISRAKALLRQIIGWQKAHSHPFDFTVEVPVIIADDPELMNLMAQAGIRKVFLGLETNNQDALEECHKWQNLGRDLVADCRTIMRHGLIPMSGFMVGFDADNPDAFADDMIRFIQESGIVVAMVGIKQAQTGTVDFDKLKKEGRLKGELVSNTAWEPNFVPAMPLKTLVEGYKRIVETINLPQKYYERIRVFLENYDASNRPKRKLRSRDLKAFAKSIWRIGVCGGFNVSWYYWKTLFATLFKNPRALAEAVIFQIYGLHFRESERH